MGRSTPFFRSYRSPTICIIVSSTILEPLVPYFSPSLVSPSRLRSRPGDIFIFETVSPIRRNPCNHLSFAIFEATIPILFSRRVNERA